MQAALKQIDRVLPDGSTLQLARVSRMDSNGRLWVQIDDGRTLEAIVEMRDASAVADSDWQIIGSDVVVFTDDNEAEVCRLVGFVQRQQERDDGDENSDRDALSFSASRRISIRCGKSSIELRRNGQVIIRGTEVVTRASGRNKIKGSSVLIN